jgi:hypothetical protein
MQREKTQIDPAANRFGQPQGLVFDAATAVGYHETGALLPSVCAGYFHSTFRIS